MGRRDPLYAQKIKEQVTEFDKKTRTLSGILNRVHSTRSEQSKWEFASLQMMELVLMRGS